MSTNKVMVFSEEGQWLHELNDIELEICEMYDGTLSLEKITDRICDEFDVEKEVVEAHIQSFIEDISLKGLITFK